VRPWQHVLDPVLGYLLLAEKLSEGDSFAGGWNFGPGAESEVTVREIVERLLKLWGNGARWEVDGGPHVREAAYLKLDCHKARTRLNWTPHLNLALGLELTVNWYKAAVRGDNLRDVSLDQIDYVLEHATNRAAGHSYSEQSESNQKRFV
jgi:CDP-glucose 4,6-dehydratase